MTGQDGNDMNQVIALIDKYVAEAKTQEKYFRGQPEQLSYWQGHIDALLLLKDDILDLDKP